MKRTPRFSKRGLTALDGSIRKWEKIVDGTGCDIGTRNCQLCTLYYRNNCLNCPVNVFSGDDNCKGTPYWAFRARASITLDDEMRARANTPKAIRYAKLELAFLRKVRKWYLTFKGKPCQKQR